METKLLSGLQPVYREIYVQALNEEGLKVYTKDFNLDGWIRGIDVFLVYDNAQELERAREIIRELESGGEIEDTGDAEESDAKDE